MEIRESREGDVLVLAPDGNVAGSEETSAMEAKLGTALKTGFRLLVLDCTGVGQLTSAAIRILLMTSRKLERTAGRLVLCGMNAKVQKAFAISGFDKDFTVVVTRAEAVQRVLEPARPRSVRAAKAPPPKAAVVVPAPEPVVEKPVEVVEDAPAGQRPRLVAPAVPPPVPDFLALATVLLDTLGVQASRPAAAGRIARPDLDVLVGRILATLRVGVA